MKWRFMRFEARQNVHNETVKDITAKGDQLYNAMYGSTADNVQSLLDKVHPDMGQNHASL